MHRLGCEFCKEEKIRRRRMRELIVIVIILALAIVVSAVMAVKDCEKDDALRKLANESRHKADEHLSDVGAAVVKRTTFDVEAFLRNLDEDLRRGRERFESEHADEIERLKL